MKAFLRCFIKSSAQVLCPQGHYLGLNALRLRGGMGTAQAPIYDDALRMCVSLARSARWEWPCHCRGVGAASAPTFKNLYASFPNISSSFSAFSAPVLCPQGHHWGCNIPCCRGRGASSPTKTYVHCRIGNRAYKKRRSREARPDSAVLDL